MKSSLNTEEIEILELRLKARKVYFRLKMVLLMGLLFLGSMNVIGSRGRSITAGSGGTSLMDQEGPLTTWLFILFLASVMGFFIYKYDKISGLRKDLVSKKKRAETGIVEGLFVESGDRVIKIKDSKLKLKIDGQTDINYDITIGDKLEFEVFDQSGNLLSIQKINDEAVNFINYPAYEA